MPIRPLLALSLLLVLGACAAAGPYPSLAPRALERNLTGGSAPAGCPVDTDPAAAFGGSAAETTAAPVSDPQLRSRVAELVQAARAGQSEFAGLLPGAERSVAAAGAAGSEPWIAAQQEVSRLEAARARTSDALAELDSLSIRPAAGPAVNEADYAAVLVALEEVRGIARAQDEALDRVSGQLPGF